MIGFDNSGSEFECFFLREMKKCRNKSSNKLASESGTYDNYSHIVCFVFITAMDVQRRVCTVLNTESKKH